MWVRVYNLLIRAGYRLPDRDGRGWWVVDANRVALADDDELLAIYGLGQSSLRAIRRMWPRQEDWSI